MDVAFIIKQLEELGSPQIKQIYINHGAHEPLFGVTTKAMKPLAKQIKKHHKLAMALYATGNYDAIYLAGMIAEPDQMCKEDFETWIATAYCPMMSDYVTAVALAETAFAQEVADEWIKSDKEYTISAGWSCYCSMLTVRSDDSFDTTKLQAMLYYVRDHIHTQPNHVKYAMNNFVIAIGISYQELHKEALQIAKHIGPVYVDMGKTSCKTPDAAAYIQKAVTTGRIGYKRKKYRC